MGAGGVVVAMYVFRRYYKLEKYITELHFDRMGQVTVLLALLYLYFNINEYLVPAFKMKKNRRSTFDKFIQWGIFPYVLVRHSCWNDVSDHNSAV